MDPELLGLLRKISMLADELQDTIDLLVLRATAGQGPRQDEPHHELPGPHSPSSQQCTK